MPETIIADASCLVVLANIDRLDLLHAVYGRVITTPEIAAEFKMELPEWLTVTAPVDRRMIEQINQDIDLGEATAIALGLEMRASLLILDDLSARLVADGFRLPYTGTLGVLSRAKREGHLASIAPIIQEMIAVKFRMSDRLIKAVLSENGET